MQVGVHDLAALVLGTMAFVILWHLVTKPYDPHQMNSLWHSFFRSLASVRQSVFSAETVTGQEAEFIDELADNVSVVFSWLVKACLILVYLLAVLAWLASTMNNGVNT